MGRHDLPPAGLPAGFRLPHDSAFALSAPFDLADDRRLAGALLDAFARELDTQRRIVLLRLAIDVFELQWQIAELAGLPIGRQISRGLLNLIELVEMTSPTGRLYFARGRELREQMLPELARQDRLYTRIDPGLVLIDAALLRQRQNLIQRASALVRPQPQPDRDRQPASVELAA